MPKLAKRLRYEVLRRDGFRCRYCGATPEDGALQVDHVIPEALGGTNEPSNLAAACGPCNSGKSSSTPDAPLVDEVAEGALRWAGAMQRAVSAMEEKFLAERDAQGEFLDLWNVYEVGGKTMPLPADWDSAITRLRSAGLTLTLIEEAIDAAMRAYKVLPENRFRYFCGVAWNMVTKLQQAALDIAVDGEPREQAAAPRYKSAEEAVAGALDAAMDSSGILLEPYQYDELVVQLALRLSGR